MFWNKYPYTDFSQINLDWLMRQIRELWAKIKGIDDHIESYVEDTVEKMIEDGSFDDVVKVYFDDSIKRFSGLADVQTARKFRLIDEIGYQDMTAKGTNLVFVANITGGIRITETDSTGNVIRYNDLNTVPTSNSIAYNAEDNMLYIAAPNYGIYVVDYGTLTLTSTITISNYNLFSCAVKDGELYSLCYYSPMDTTRIIKIVNGAANPVVDMVLPDVSPFSIIYQSIEIVDDCVYVLFARPNAVGVIDMDSGRFTLYGLGDGSGFYPYGEMEGIAAYDGSVYILSAYGDGRQTNISQVFNTNIIGNLVGDANIFGQNPYINERSTLYVDSDSTDTNPTGYLEHPMKCVTEAVAQFKYLAGKYFVAISCAENGDFSDEVITLTNSFISFNGGNNTFYEIVMDCCSGQLYNFATTDRCALLNFNGRVNWYEGGTKLQLNAANVTLSNITPNVDATYATVAELTTITYGTTSNLIRLEAQA